MLYISDENLLNTYLVKNRVKVSFSLKILGEGIFTLKFSCI